MTEKDTEAHVVLIKTMKWLQMKYLQRTIILKLMCVSSVIKGIRITTKSRISLWHPGELKDWNSLH